MGAHSDPATAMTERQKKWFATVRANFETATGRSMADWVAIARTCPETAPKARSQWLKREHGLGQNHAAFVLLEAFPPDGPDWSDDEGLRATLWKDPNSLAVLAAVEAVAHSHDGVLQTQRKSYTAWSRQVQFAAARPLPKGRARLGLKLDPDASPRLQRSPRQESWSERIVAIVEFDSPGQVDEEIAALFAAAMANG